MRKSNASVLIILLCVFAIAVFGQIFRPGMFLPNRVVITTALGELTTATGADTDCVRVNGTAGACGSGGGSSVAFVDLEVPSGAINGSNAAYVLAFGPVSGSVHVWKNGQLMDPAGDYSIAGSTVTFAGGSIPQTGDTVRVSYRR